MNALDARDHETEAHTQRVSHITMTIGRAANLGTEELKALQRGALLHDIGKIGISDTVLLKNGKLDKTEWDLMQKHPVIGAEIIKGIPSLGDALTVIANHHERWDGSGYPNGLVGEEIPFLARIFIVADVFEALTSDRVYRKHISYADALEYIKSQSGVLFDPKIVQILEEIVDYFAPIGLHNAIDMTLPSKNSTNPLHSRQLGLPVLIIGLVISVGLVGFGALADLTSQQRWLNILTGLAGAAYSLTFPTFVISISRRYPLVWWLMVIVNSLIVAWLSILETASFHGLSMLTFIILVLGCAVLAGRWQTYAFVVGALLMYHLLPVLVHAAPIPLSTQDQIALVFASAVINETTYLLISNINHHFRRLEVVNQMTRSLAFSIEIPQVVSLMSAAIQSALEADTYYIGFLIGEKIDFELFYDDGIFYPATSVSVNDSLAGWVVKNRKPILLSDTLTQLEQLGLPSKVIGKPHISLSWMGIPLQSRERVYGIVAVASYQKNAFNPSDLELLGNFAQQASISLDNATHHAEVEKKSIQDSLTNVLNHGNFLRLLADEAEKSHYGNYPLSLIMLDVDYF